MKAFLPEQTRVSQVHLRTARLERAVGFYTEVLGFTVLERAGDRANLAPDASGPALLVLTEDRQAPPRAPRALGLYHYAIRYHLRHDLAAAYRRLTRRNYPIAGAADHGVSEAVYLNDPDGNGIELCADRPRDQWPEQHGAIAMTTQPLDLESLLASGANSSAHTAGSAEIGHIHLHVPDLASAERFYAEFLGLAVTQRSYRGALFFAAGRYHHHIGVNVWGGRAAPPMGSVGLVSYRLEVPVTEILYCLNHRAPVLRYETKTGLLEGVCPILQIQDPSGCWLEVQPSAAAAVEAAPGICQPCSTAA